MADRTRRAWRVLGLSGVVLAVAAVAIDVAQLEPPSGWWDTEPMVAEIIGGILLLLVGVFIVDTYVQRRQALESERALEARWDALGGIPFRSLGRSMTRLIDGMAWLLTTAPSHGRPSGFDMRSRRRLRWLLWRSHFQTIDTRDPGAFPHEELRPRLAALLKRDAWCRLAHEGLDQVKWELRDRTALWAAPMLAVEQLAQVLARLGAVDDAIGGVQARLRRLSRFPEHEPRPDDAGGLIEDWFAVLAEAVSLREDLHRAALTSGRFDADVVRAEMKSREKFGWALTPEHRGALAARARQAGADRNRARKMLLTRLGD